LADFPAFSALRLAALGSTAALNLAPATNFGNVLAGIFRVAPVDGFARAGYTLDGLEGAKTYELHSIAFLDGCLDGIDQRFQDCIGCRLG
jgi:hypothetical protein